MGALGIMGTLGPMGTVGAGQEASTQGNERSVLAPPNLKVGIM